MSPKLRANSICCSGVIVTSRNTSTRCWCHAVRIASTVAASSTDDGSTPVISAPMVPVIGCTAMVTSESLCMVDGHTDSPRTPASRRGLVTTASTGCSHCSSRCVRVAQHDPSDVRRRAFGASTGSPSTASRRSHRRHGPVEQVLEGPERPRTRVSRTPSAAPIRRTRTASSGSTSSSGLKWGRRERYARFASLPRSATPRCSSSAEASEISNAARRHRRRG